MPFGADWRALGTPGDDAMDAHTRLAMYRVLVERSNAHRAFGPDDELNPFWGYASQLAWQQRSGRLGPGIVAGLRGEPGSAPVGTAIDIHSWWGACNYALSVVPYVAAMGLAIVPRLAISIEPAFERVVPLWHAALHALRDARPGDDLDGVRVAVW